VYVENLSRLGVGGFYNTRLLSARGDFEHKLILNR